MKAHVWIVEWDGPPPGKWRLDAAHFESEAEAEEHAYLSNEARRGCYTPKRFRVAKYVREERR